MTVEPIQVDPDAERYPTSIIICAWLLGGHDWRLLGRWDWKTRRRTIDRERCTRCGVIRPRGGFFGARRRDLALIH